MKTTVTVSFLLSLLLLAGAQTPVSILGISTKIDNPNQNAGGSLLGGTIIYVRALGLDPTPSNNIVRIGDNTQIACSISGSELNIFLDKGVNGIYLACQTLAALTTDLGSQQVYLSVAGNAETTCTNCKFSFTQSRTPTLNMIVPRTITPNQVIDWNANYIVKEIDEIQDMLIGSLRCSRFGDLKTEAHTRISGTLVKCQVAAVQEAGYQDVILRTDSGYAKESPATTSWSVVRQNSKGSPLGYQAIVLASIASLGTNYVSTQGQIMKIKGNGFPTDKAKVKVFAVGVEATVLSVQQNFIEALVPAWPDNFVAPTVQPGVAKFIGGGGLRWTLYNVAPSGIYDCDNLRTQLLTKGADSLPILQDGVRGEPHSTTSLGEYIGQFYRGYFKAPKTGDYKFYITADDCSSVWINKTPNSPDTATMTKVASMGCCSGEYNYLWYQTHLPYPSQISAPIPLTAGEHYYIQFFHINGGGPGYFSVAVEVPSDTLRPDSRTEVQQLTVSYTPINEQIDVKIYNTAANTPLTGTFKLQFQYLDPATRKYPVNCTTDAIDPKAAATLLRDSIAKQCKYDNSIQATKIDNTGAELADQSATAFAGYRYLISFTYVRSTDAKLRVLPTILTTLAGGTVGKSTSKIQEPSAQIGGTYGLVFNNKQVLLNDDAKIPITAESYQLEAALTAAAGFQVQVWINGNPLEKATIYVNFAGQPGDVPLLQTDTSGLTGGKAGTSPTIVASDYMSGSNNAFLSIIPGELFFTAHDTPQLVVVANDVYSTCQDKTCDLTIASDQTPQLDAYTYTAATGALEITLTDPRTTKYTAADLKITFGQQPCTGITVVSSTVQCTVVPQLQVGTWVPEIEVSPIGFVKIKNTVVATTQGLTISTVTPAQSSTQGGTQITLTGTGFPLNSEQLGKFEVKIGEVVVPTKSFKTVSATSLIFTAPAQENGASNSVITVTQKELSTTATKVGFTYSDALTITISSVSPKTASPVKKQAFTILGTNFGADKTKLKVYLVEKTADGVEGKQYQLNILSVDTFSGSDRINAFLGGGKSGDYEVRVERDEYGFSKPASAVTDDEFSYQVTVTSVTPNSGSKAGGTVLTITGTNFAPEDTVVFIGSAMNWICSVLTSTATQLTCITPPRSPLAEYDSAVGITVTSKLIDKAKVICADGSTCTFTYAEDKTPSQTVPADAKDEEARVQNYQPVHHSRRVLVGGPQKHHRRFLWTDETRQNNENHLKHYIAQPNRRQLVNTLAYDNTPSAKYVDYKTGDTVTIAGTGFGANPSVVIGLYAKITSFTTQTDTQLVFVFPGLPTGSHQLQVVDETNGYADGAWNAHVVLTAGSVNPTTGSRGGELITISGGGFNTPSVIEDAKLTGEVREAPTVTVGGLPCMTVTVVNTETITCVTPALNTDTVVPIVVTQPNAYTKIAETATGPQFTPSITTFAFINGVTQAVNVADSVDITASGQRLDADTAPVVKLVANGNGESITGSVISKTSDQLTLRFANVPAGTYTLTVIYGTHYATFDQFPRSQITLTLGTWTATSSGSSLYGGGAVTFSGKGFSATNSVPKVCGFPCKVTTATYSSLTCSAPPLVTSSTLAATTEPEDIDLNAFTFSYDKAQDNVVSDNNLQTVYNSKTDGCFIKMDFGTDLRLKLKQLKYFPSVAIDSALFSGSIFEYSTDDVTYTPLLTVDSTVHAGWNQFVSEVSNIRYIRYSDASGSTRSQCRLAELGIQGWLLYKTDLDITNAPCPTSLSVNKQTATGTGTVTYKQAFTPTVTALSPPYGKSPGGTTLTITGTGFGVDTNVIKVQVEEVDCVVSTVIDTQIVCVTGDKDAAMADMDMSDTDHVPFSVSVSGQQAQLKTDPFFYANPWSDDAVWGGDIPPRDGDVVVVPAGQTLLVDIAESPKLLSVLVEGKLIFKDGLDINFNAGHILVRMGVFQIGTYSKPHTSKLTITLSGNRLDLQLPDFGNKFIGCHQCQLDIHGVKLQHTWSMLASTADVGTTTVTLLHAVDDWKVGDSIVIAASQWNHLQAEQRVITAIATTGQQTTLTLDKPLEYRHYSAVETYGTEKFSMRSEVGLLTRNIVIRGDPADSISSQYGAHLMIHGMGSRGAVGRISFAEFTNVGQPAIMGRYPIHFHLNGPMHDSFVEGNAVHHSHARIVTIHGTHYLRVFNNVGYKCLGHAIFLEDGIETNNVIHDNLILGNQQAWFMLQTDITTSAYWITNPQNDLYNNHAAGSEWYGFWYEVKEHPDGPSATGDICPPGLPLGKFENNVAHSNGRFGLRILKIAATQKPCSPSRNDRSVDPFSANPSIESVFKNFTTFSNNECGILGEQLGTVTFRDFQVADSKKAAFQTHVTNFTKEGATIENFLIVGQSQGNANTEANYYNGSIGVITPRTSGFYVKNVRFQNFKTDMVLVGVCSECSTTVTTSSKNSFFSQIQILNSLDFTYLKWQGSHRDIVWDTDGSLTGVSGGAQVTPYKVHLDGIDGCETKTGIWANSLVCTSSKVQLRDFLVVAPQPMDNFKKKDMKVNRYNAQENLLELPDNKFQNEPWFDIMNPDIKDGFGVPLALGTIYNVHWQRGINFENLGAQASEYLTITDPGYIIRFNYTNTIEAYDVTRLVGGSAIPLNSDQVLNAIPDAVTCNNADNFLDKEAKALYVCFSGRGRGNAYEYVNVHQVLCRSDCATGPTDSNEPKVEKRWSVATDWPLGKPTGNEEEVVIPQNWKLILDESTPLLQRLVVDGQIVFDTKVNSTTRRLLQDAVEEELLLKAKIIWIRKGSIVAGSATTPYTGKAAIELYGDLEDPQLLIDPFVEASNKVLAVTGALNIYAPQPASVWTRLTVFAKAGDTTITVADATGWKAGDQLAISPSGRIPQQHEKVTISSIAGNVITLAEALQFPHFGAADITIDKGDIGKLDMRAAVGHLTRSFQIRGATSDWGGRVLIYQTTDETSTLTYRGSTQLYGVEFVNMGQQDTSNSGLDLRFLNDPTQRIQSTVQGCSFHDSNGQLFNSETSYDVKVDNNVFYRGVKILAQMISGVNNIFSNNLLIYVQQRISGGTPDVAVLGQFTTEWDGFDFSIDNVQIINNVAQGSESHGLYLGAIACDKVDKIGVYNNVASSIAGIALSFRKGSVECSTIAQNHAFHAARAVMAAEAAHEIHVQNLIAAESDISLVLKMGVHNVYNNQIKISNIFITALARPDCPECYSETLGSPCHDQIGMQLGATSTVALEPYQASPGLAFDFICTTQQLDGRVYIDGAIFENFKFKYDLPQCSNNRVFRPHGGAIDTTMGHYLTNTVCNNCDQDAKFKFQDPSPSEIGWFGGCGSFVCTGRLNILVHDTDGKFLGTNGPSSAISNNTWFGANVTTCVRNNQWNGYHCKDDRTAILYFVSIAPDYNKRLYSPVNLTNGVFFNKLNSLREWGWDGGEPLNTRESKFVALVQLSSVINMTNTGQNPSDSQYWFQRRNKPEGLKTDWVIIQLQFQTSHTLQVLVGEQGKDVIVPGFAQKNPVDLLTQTTVCGANNYFPQNNTIHFVVIGDSCLVRVRQINSVQITMHFEVDYDKFFEDTNLKVKFDTIYLAFLSKGGIDTSKVKTVGYRKGSVVRNDAIEVTTGATDNDAASIKKLNAVKKLAKDLQTEMAKSDGEFSSLGYRVAVTEINTADPIDTSTIPTTEPVEKRPTSSTSSIVFEEKDESNNDDDKTTGIIVGVVVGVLGSAILVGIVYLLYTYKKKQIAHIKVKHDENEQTLKRSDIESPNQGNQLEQQGFEFHKELKQ